jgi:hypothetical protein
VKVCACGKLKRSAISPVCATCRRSSSVPVRERAPGGARRGGVFHVYDVCGVMLNVAELAEVIGVSKAAIHQRIGNGTPLLAARMRK